MVFKGQDGSVICLNGVNCFVKNTAVKTQEGYKAIQDLKIGDVVLSFNEESKVTEYKKVKQLFTKTISKLNCIIAGTDTILCTPEHKFFSVGKWVKASTLGVGMMLQLGNGAEASIISNSPFDTTATVYNFEVEDNHNYYVGRQGILVHNDCGSISDLVSANKLSQADVAEFAKDFAGNDVMLSKFKSGELEVDAWKSMREAGIDDVLRKDPDAIKAFASSSTEGLDPTDAINDAIQASGKTKPTWPEIKALFKRGNDFNRKAVKNDWYPFNEVHLSNGKRVDSYNPIKGEIVSRKATDLNNIQKSTFEGYLKELQNKYASGTIIRSNKYPQIDGQQLLGKQILEIPESNQSFGMLQEYVDLATDYNIEIRFRPE